MGGSAAEVGGSLIWVPGRVRGIISSVIMAHVNPHGLGFARSLESTFAIEIQSAPVRSEHMLVESLITRHEAAHQLCANAAPLVLWQYQQMRIVNNEVTIGNRVAKSDKFRAIPSRDQ